MVTQTCLNLNVKDVTGQLESRVSVARDRHIADARPEFLTALGLPVEDNGQPLSYGTVNETQKCRLGDADVVGETTNENDVIRMVPEITAAS